MNLSIDRSGRDGAHNGATPDCPPAASALPAPPPTPRRQPQLTCNIMPTPPKAHHSPANQYISHQATALYHTSSNIHSHYSCNCKADELNPCSRLSCCSCKHAVPRFQNLGWNLNISTGMPTTVYSLHPAISVHFGDWGLD